MKEGRCGGVRILSADDSVIIGAKGVEGLVLHSLQVVKVQRVNRFRQNVKRIYSSIV